MESHISASLRLNHINTNALAADTVEAVRYFLPDKIIGQTC